MSRTAVYCYKLLKVPRGRSAKTSSTSAFSSCSTGGRIHTMLMLCIDRPDPIDTLPYSGWRAFLDGKDRDGGSVWDALVERLV